VGQGSRGREYFAKKFFPVSKFMRSYEAALVCRNVYSMAAIVAALCISVVLFLQLFKGGSLAPSNLLLHDLVIEPHQTCNCLRLQAGSRACWALAL
jgi:hypothetical protein